MPVQPFGKQADLLCSTNQRQDSKIKIIDNSQPTQGTQHNFRLFETSSVQSSKLLQAQFRISDGTHLEDLNYQYERREISDDGPLNIDLLNQNQNSMMWMNSQQNVNEPYIDPNMMSANSSMDPMGNNQLTEKSDQMGLATYLQIAECKETADIDLFNSIERSTYEQRYQNNQRSLNVEDAQTIEQITDT